MRTDPKLAIAAPALKALMESFAGSPTISSRGHRIGPGKKSIVVEHRRFKNSKYTGADLRALRAERGVGRPPGKGGVTA